jgi:hypothetical protein
MSLAGWLINKKLAMRGKYHYDRVRIEMIEGFT